MNLLDLAIKVTCEDEASTKIDKISAAATAKATVIGNIITSGLSTAANAITGLGSTMLSSYASYEQLVGGMDTLFKDASGKMQEYAANAYETAGVSANRYMEISTSFAAALVSSLGGDTQAAAEMANQAVQDMSDNANKMGTSLETVQEAYMSLSRGNYEMLDSLKLGYGGTKSELERLLSDAEQLAAAQGDVRDFSVESYSDIVEAIHLVQDEMGITGTTSLEAASTIEGSVNTMKAAWENWLAGLGNENADMGELSELLVNSVITAGNNVIPRVAQIATSIGQTLVSNLPSAISDFEIALMDVLPPVIREPFDVFSDALDDASDGAMQAIDFLQNTFGPGVEQAMGLIGPIVETAWEFFDHMGAQIQEVLGPALEFLGEAFEDAMGAIEPWIEPLGNVAELFGNILVAAIAVFVYAIGGALEAFTVITAAVQDLDNFLNGQPSVIGSVIDAIIAWFQQLPGNIANFLMAIISDVISWAAQMGSNAINAATQFVSSIVDTVASLPGRFAQFLDSIISNVLSWASQMANQATKAAADFGSNLINQLSSIPGRVVEIGSQIINGLISGVHGAAQGLINSVTGVVDDAIQAAKNLLGIASPSKVFRQIGRYTMQGMALGIDDDSDLAVQSTDDAMRSMISSVQPIAMPATQAQNQGASSLIDEVRALRDDIKGMKIYLNGRTLVGGIADDMDRELGRRAVWSATR